MKNFFTPNTATPPVDVAPAAINVTFAIQTGHTEFLPRSIFSLQATGSASQSRRSRPALSIFRAVVTVFAIFSVIHLRVVSRRCSFAALPARTVRLRRKQTVPCGACCKQPGTKNSVANVAKIKPPMIARPSGAFCSPPSPRPNENQNHAMPEPIPAKPLHTSTHLNWPRRASTYSKALRSAGFNAGFVMSISNANNDTRTKHAPMCTARVIIMNMLAFASRVLCFTGQPET